MENWKDFNFKVDGINFISRVNLNSPLGMRIKNLPAGMFEQMNEGAIRSFVNTGSTLATISEQLKKVNEGGSYAFIMLGDNN